MAKKQKTPEQLAVSRAKRQPERWWFASRRMFWVNFSWPGPWGFWTDYNELAFGAGEPKVQYDGPEVPESQFSFDLRVWPPRLIAFWHVKRILWIGDREWKQGLRNE